MNITTYLRSGVRYLGSIVLVAAAAVFVLVFLAQVTGRYRFVPVLSGSMSPHVEAGDLAILEPLTAAELSEGDVIAFEAPVEGSPLTLHRVTEIVSRSPELVIRTKGDANTAADPWQARIAEDQLWQTTAHVDKIGSPIVYLNRVRTRFLWISVAALLFGWWGMAAIWRDKIGRGDSDIEQTPEPDSGAPPSAQRARIAPSAPVTAGMLLLVALGGMATFLGSGAAAVFTGQVAAEQRVTSAQDGPSLKLDADLLCSAEGIPTSIELVWTPAPGDVTGYEVYRGSLFGGPYDTLVGTTSAEELSFSDPIANASGAPLYYVVRSIGVPVEESNEATAVTLCDDLVPAAAPEVEPVPTEPEVAAPEVEPVPTEPEVAAPEVEPVPTEPEVAAPEVEPVPTEPEVAAPEVEPVPTEPEVAAPEVATPDPTPLLPPGAAPPID